MKRLKAEPPRDLRAGSVYLFILVKALLYGRGYVRGKDKQKGSRGCREQQEKLNSMPWPQVSWMTWSRWARSKGYSSQRSRPGLNNQCTADSHGGLGTVEVHSTVTVVTVTVLTLSGDGDGPQRLQHGTVTEYSSRLSRWWQPGKLKLSRGLFSWVALGGTICFRGAVSPQGNNSSLTVEETDLLMLIPQLFKLLARNNRKENLSSSTELGLGENCKDW